MGSKQSKPSEPEPQLYAVATPHPTMKWIYPVYAAPLDATPLQQDKKGRSSPLAWLGGGEKSKSRNDIPVVAQHHERVPIPDGTVVNEDGTWYHFHVDAGGAVDYIRPGTTLPNTFPDAGYAPPPRTFEGSIAPSMSMAGVPYEESYYSYPASPAYQGYHHPQPQRIAHSDAYSMGSAPSPYPYPRARSVSPVHTRAITPTNLKPRRATTPTPRRSKTPNYEPAPPVPEHIAPAPRRSSTPFPNRKALPVASSHSPRTMDSRGYMVDDREYRVEPREYRVEQREPRGEHRDPRQMAYATTSGRTSRTSRRPSPDDDTTAIASSNPPDHGSITVKSVQSRPYSPIPPSDPVFYGNAGDATLRSTQQKYRRHYPSPSTINSQPASTPDIYA